MDSTDFLFLQLLRHHRKWKYTMQIQNFSILAYAFCPIRLNHFEGHHFYHFFSHTSINYPPLFLLLLHLTRGSRQKLIGILFERHLDAVMVDNWNLSFIFSAIHAFNTRSIIVMRSNTNADMTLNLSAWLSY